MGVIRRVITRFGKKNTKLWIRIFPDQPITFRAAETRMGSGKGSVEYWVAIIRKGKVLFEIKGLTQLNSRLVLKLASYKLPFRTKFIS